MNGNGHREHMSLPSTQAAALVQLVREIVGLLTELVTRYELSRQLGSTSGRVVRKPADVAEYLGPEMADLAQEQLRAILLNTRNRVLATTLVYHGGLNSIVIRLADCFREAVRVNAAAVILVHNHPSGEVEPSEEDIRVTEDASQAGDLLGIEVLDHIVLSSDRTFTSLRERGLYRPMKYQQVPRPRRAAGCSTPQWEVSHA